jgi:hypothetical protein
MRFTAQVAIGRHAPREEGPQRMVPILKIWPVESREESGDLSIG